MSIIKDKWQDKSDWRANPRLMYTNGIVARVLDGDRTMEERWSIDCGSRAVKAHWGHKSVADWIGRGYEAVSNRVSDSHLY